MNRTLQTMPDLDLHQRVALGRSDQNRLEMMLRQVDDERVARLLRHRIQQDRKSGNLGAAINLADLVDAQGLRQHILNHAIAA